MTVGERAEDVFYVSGRSRPAGSASRAPASGLHGARSRQRSTGASDLVA